MQQAPSYCVPHKEEKSKLFGNSSVMNTVVFESTVLQTLDRRVGDRQLIFPREEFEKSVDDWDGIPVIYHPKAYHPLDFDAVDEDPAKASEEMGGRLIGFVVNPRIEIEGHPRLVCSIDMLPDNDDIIELWKKGKLTPSTAFMAGDDGDKLTTPPIPNHVLFFEEVVDKALPGDPGAFVHTSDTSKREKKCRVPFYERLRSLVKELMREEGGKTLVNAEAKTEYDEPRVEDKEESKEEKSMPEEGGAPATDLEAINKMLEEKDAKIAELEAQVAALKEQIAGQGAIAEELANTKRELEVFKEKEETEKFNSVLNSIPAGMKATPEMVEGLRKQFKEDPVSLMINVLGNVNKGGETDKVGNQFANTNGNISGNDGSNWARWNSKGGN